MNKRLTITLILLALGVSLSISMGVLSHYKPTTNGKGLIEDTARQGHVEFLPTTSIINHDLIQLEPGIWLVQKDITGNLPCDSSPEDTFVVYANRLGPFGSGDISWRIQTLSPAEYPLSITIVEGGKSLWTSSFMPE